MYLQNENRTEHKSKFNRFSKSRTFDVDERHKKIVAKLFINKIYDR